MNRFAKPGSLACLAIMVAFSARNRVCVATTIHVDTDYGSHSENFDPLPPAWNLFGGIETVSYVSPPSFDPSPTNLFGKSNDGNASLFLMDERWGGPSLHVEFDWIFLEATQLKVTTTIQWYYTYVTSTVFPQLPPAPSEYASIPEARRVSFYLPYGTPEYRDLDFHFFGTNVAGGPAPFGLDNFKVSVVPEPASASSCVLAIAFASLGVRRQKRQVVTDESAGNVTEMGSGLAL
jgi:hypothetical protein